MQGPFTPPTRPLPLQTQRLLRVPEQDLSVQQFCLVSHRSPSCLNVHPAPFTAPAKRPFPVYVNPWLPSQWALPPAIGLCPVCPHVQVSASP